MLNGNPLMRGWTVADISFYTIEIPSSRCSSGCTAESRPTS